MESFERLYTFGKDLEAILSENERLRERNAYLEKELKEINEWITDTATMQQNLAVETIKELINAINIK